jgi:hypothetical protein
VRELADADTEAIVYQELAAVLPFNPDDRVAEFASDAHPPAHRLDRRDARRVHRASVSRTARGAPESAQKLGERRSSPQQYGLSALDLRC